MKKLFAGMLTAALVLSLGSTSALAAGKGQGRRLADINASCSYAHTSHTSMNVGGSGANFVDNDGDGVCDNRNTTDGANANGCQFTDSDGDGVCDNQGNATQPQDGTGHGIGCGAGQGAGQGNGCRGGRGR